MNTTREYAITSFESIVDCKKAKNIEKSIFNFTIDYCEKNSIENSWENIIFGFIYKVKLNEIFKALYENTELLSKIESKEISTKDICNINLSKLSKAKSNELDDQEQEEIADGVFECGKCGSKKTTFYSLQTRSADEPMTNFITCIQCKNRWKM